MLRTEAMIFYVIKPINRVFKAESPACLPASPQKRNNRNKGNSAGNESRNDSGKRQPESQTGEGGKDSQSAGQDRP